MLCHFVPHEFRWLLPEIINPFQLHFTTGPPDFLPFGIMPQPFQFNRQNGLKTKNWKIPCPGPDRLPHPHPSSPHQHRWPCNTSQRWMKFVQFNHGMNFVPFILLGWAMDRRRWHQPASRNVWYSNQLPDEQTEWLPHHIRSSRSSAQCTFLYTFRCSKFREYVGLLALALGWPYTVSDVNHAHLLFGNWIT